MLFSEYNSFNETHLWGGFTDEARSQRQFDNLTNVEEIMNTWTQQVGYPEVVVTRNYDSNEVDFAQQLFTYIGNRSIIAEKDSSEESPTWWIPITYTTDSERDFNDTEPVDWMRNSPSLTLSVQNISADEWIIVNVRQTSENLFRFLCVQSIHDCHHFKVSIELTTTPEIGGC